MSQPENNQHDSVSPRAFIQDRLNILEESEASNRADVLKRLSKECREVFESSGHLPVLELEITFRKQELQLVSREALAGSLTRLGLAYELRFNLLGQESDFDDLLDCHERAVSIDESSSTTRFQCQRNLALSLADRFQLHGDPADLYRAIEVLREALQSMPEDWRSRAMFLGSYGAFLLQQYRITGKLADLDEGLLHLQQAIEAECSDSPSTYSYYGNLGTGLRERYQNLNREADLDMSVSSYERGMETVIPTSPEYLTLSIGLGVALRHRYERTQDISDLQRCIGLHKHALNLLPTTGEDHRDCLQNLAMELLCRFRNIDDYADMEQAITYARQSLDAHLEDQMGYVTSLMILAFGLSCRYESLKNPADLNDSINYMQSASLKISSDELRFSRIMIMLGMGLATRYDALRNPEDAVRSTEAFVKASESSAAEPHIRIWGGMLAFENLTSVGSWEAAVAVVEPVLELLPETVPPTKSRTDLQASLRQITVLGSCAASAYLKAGRTPMEALQVLEKARGVIASLRVDARSDASVLKASHPEIWSQYVNIRDQIALRSRNSPFEPVERSATNVAELQLLLSRSIELKREIRQLPGHERFLLHPTDDEILAMAKKGPIVSFNVNNLSSEAFVVLTDGVYVVELPDLNVSDVLKQVSHFTRYQNHARRDATLLACEDSDDESGGNDPEDTSSTVDLLHELGLLWTNAIQPVLEKARIINSSELDGTIQSLYWVGGGIMALLPLHAAGDHRPGCSENVFSHAMSSFAPSLKVLQHIRSQEALLPKYSSDAIQEILVVSMASTPGGYAPLNVSNEVKAITASLAPTSIGVTHLERPGKNDVLMALEKCSLVHFACHGTADALDPSNSALLLGTSSEERLTVADIDMRSHNRAKVAYLSACSTAEAKVFALVEESLHLACFFQLAGFASVIGTLWGVDDSAASIIASDFYTNLARGKSMKHRSVCWALHSAVLKYRNSGTNYLNVHLWAPFICFGG